MMHKEEEKSRMVCPFRVHGVTTPSATIPDAIFGMNILCRACMMTAPPIGVKNIPETPRRARKISSSNIAHDWRNEKCE